MSKKSRVKKIFLGLMFFSWFLCLVAQAQPILNKNNSLVSINFQEIKLRNVLQLLADFSGFNLIVSDAVQGNVSLHLENISWQQALDIILQSQGLGKRTIGNVIIVAPYAEIANQEKQALQVQQQMHELAPLQAELLQIKYGKASQLATLLKDKNNSLLSSRGTVSVDDRTNTLWVQDTDEQISKVKKFVTQLDVQVREVMIEARIVNLDSNFEKELGVRLGLTGNHLSGTLQGANALHTAAPTGDIPLDQRLNVDLPVLHAGGGGSIGLALAHLSKGTMLDLELSALESEGVAEIISNPRLITANQQAAMIEAGEEIPYQESTSSGATSVTFKKAVLSLSVTPQITPDGKVMLTLKVNQDKPSSRSVQGVPAISTQQIETQVLVDNEQTIVLGGIYEQNHQTQTQRVPFLSSVPILGNLFKHHVISTKKTELLIFVTPRILES